MITINPNAQALFLIDEPTISAGEKNTIFLFFSSALFLYFYSEQKSYFESNAKQSAEMSTSHYLKFH